MARIIGPKHCKYEERCNFNKIDGYCVLKTLDKEANDCIIYQLIEDIQEIKNKIK